MAEDNIIQFQEEKPPLRFSGSPMKRELVEKASSVMPDPQILINMVSRRVKQLNDGRSPLIETVPTMGAADIALTEIIEGKIKLAEPEPVED
jgi:DNA-directed RNA polymerase subunit omega